MYYIIVFFLYSSALIYCSSIYSYINKHVYIYTPHIQTSIYFPAPLLFRLSQQQLSSPILLTLFSHLQLVYNTSTRTHTCMKATNNLHNAATSRFIEFTHDLLALLLLLLIVFNVSKYFPHNIHNNYSYILYVIPLCPTYCLYVVVFSVLRYWL